MDSSSSNPIFSDQKVPNRQFPGVWDVPPHAVHAARHEVRIVDVRQPEEYTGELGHIPGAELIVLDTLATEIERLPKTDSIVFVCRSGGRSGHATEFARAQGFKNVFNMTGGMMLWNELNLPVETR
jgi:hydroxyacylglutathione hydrolase